MKILTREQLENLNTKRLLAYKTRLLQVSSGNCWCGDPNCDNRRNELLESGVMLKSSPIWQETYNAVKEILSTREHVDRE